MRRRNGYEVVTATVSASAVSRRLSRLAPRSTKVGLGQPFKASPRTTGFRVTQVTAWEVEVWWRAAADADPAAAEAVYAGITEELTDAGFDVARREKAPGLRVTRQREPTAAEWAVLGAVAPRPVDCDRYGATEQIAAEDAYELVHSGLLALIRYPLVRKNPWEPAMAYLLALAGPGASLLETLRRHEDQNSPDTDTTEQETS
ncbi:hypothetical protein [Streptomyces sp. NPDC002078]